MEEVLEGTDTYPWNTTILAHGHDGRNYLGYVVAPLPFGVDVDTTDEKAARDRLNSYLRECVKNNEAICMCNARALISQITQQMTPAGPSVGKMTLVLGVDTYESGVKELWTQICTWYYPSDDEHVFKVMQELLKNRKEMEMANRAKASGIELASTRATIDLRDITRGPKGGLH